MRFRDILLEYSRDKTLANYGERLWNAVLHDTHKNASIYGMAIYYAKKQGLTWEENRAAHDRACATYVIDRIELLDPTPTHEYVQWIVQRFISGGIPRWEDMGRVKTYLARFDALKKSGYFRRNRDNPEIAPLADINRFATLSDLGEFLIGITAEDEKSNNERERGLEKELVENDEVEILVNDSRFKIVIPLSVRAACYYGRNTQWCTASTDSENRFADYNSEGPLYVILDKKANRRWQFHFESYQFMDENDRNIEWSNFPQEVFDYDCFDLSDLAPHMRVVLLAMILPKKLLGSVAKNSTRNELIWAWFYRYAQGNHRQLNSHHYGQPGELMPYLGKYSDNAHSGETKFGTYYTYTDAWDLLMGVIKHAKVLTPRVAVDPFMKYVEILPTVIGIYSRGIEAMREIDRATIVVPAKPHPDDSPVYLAYVRKYLNDVVWMGTSVSLRTNLPDLVHAAEEGEAGNYQSLYTTLASALKS